MFLRFNEYLINMAEVIYIRERGGNIEVKLRSGEEIILWGHNLKDLGQFELDSLMSDRGKSGWFL